ncbi:MAG: leucine-rich repeat protein [Lachnospiraceae bacterium]|nr:leucine-rich repeat protein [Lachnospiraceae bacterium]
MRIKKLLSIVLTLIMILTIFPISSYAQESDVKTDYTDAINNADLSSNSVWDIRGTKGIADGMCRVGTSEEINFCQDITLPAGQYKMTVKAVYRYGTDEQQEYDAIMLGVDTHIAKLYAETKSCRYEGTVKNRYEDASEINYYEGDDKDTAVVKVNNLYVPNSSKAVAAWFAAGKYSNELVFNVQQESIVKIGISKQGGTGDYTNIGAWTLTRLGDAQEDPVHIHTEAVVTGKAATCTEDGLTDGIVCETCGEVIKEQTKIEAIGHDWDAGVITKQPTTAENGVMTYTCKNDAQHKKTDEIAKLVEEIEVPNDTKEPNEPIENNEVIKAKAVGTSIKSGAILYIVTAAGDTPEVTVKALSNKKVKSLTIPSTIKSDNVTYKVTGIEKNVCKGNKVLKKVTISEGIKKIGANAFKGAKNLKKITIKSTVLKNVGKNAYKGIHKKAVIKVPKKQKKAYSRLFKKTGLASTVKIKA